MCRLYQQRVIFSLEGAMDYSKNIIAAAIQGLGSL